MTLEPASFPPAQGGVFSVAAVQGVTLTKWSRAWAERRPDLPLAVIRTTDDGQTEVLHDRTAVMSFLRLPADEAGLSLIPLYREVAVVVVPKDHPIAAFAAVTLADLDGENMLGGVYENAIALVAANVGVAVVPQSIGRLFNRSDVVSRPVTDAPETQIVLAWLDGTSTSTSTSASASADDIDEFVGIVRGRTAHSSRTTPTPPTVAPKKVPLKKSAAKNAIVRQRGATNRRPKRTGR